MVEQKAKILQPAREIGRNSVHSARWSKTEGSVGVWGRGGGGNDKINSTGEREESFSPASLFLWRATGSSHPFSSLFGGGRGERGWCSH